MKPTAVDTLYRFLKDKHLPVDGAHDVHTPRALVEELVSHVDLDGKTILVLFNLEFLVTLVYTYKVDPKLITFYADHLNKVKFAQRLGINNCVTQIGNITMKFDVVLGNPPFQNPGTSRGNKLWPKFIAKANELLAEDGHILMIVPSGWTAGGSNMPGDVGILRDIFSHGNLICANLSDMSSHFPGVGVSFSWFNFQKSQTYKGTSIIVDKSNYTVDFKEITFLPDDINELTLALFQKLFGNRKKFKVISFDRQKATDKSIEPTDKNTVKHWVLGTGQSTQYCYLSYDRSPDISNKRKVLLPLRKFSNVAMVHVDDVGIPVCQQGFYVDIGDNRKDFVESVWNSKLFLFLTYSIHPTGFLKTNIIKSLPYLDLSRSWTDQEIYEHFGLTQEEIDYVEANVK